MTIYLETNRISFLPVYLDSNNQKQLPSSPGLDILERQDRCKIRLSPSLYLSFQTLSTFCKYWAKNDEILWILEAFNAMSITLYHILFIDYYKSAKGTIIVLDIKSNNVHYIYIQSQSLSSRSWNRILFQKHLSLFSFLLLYSFLCPCCNVISAAQQRPTKWRK